ncbi:hypothetical protein PAPYR_6270 [Paratrimastix pyriformis]|uniref:Uncharacterized protein n=1 Tax=Paratrimastix pyriformis TaxID=342808 RepID=A0ABQ8UKB1_9EUKA|nr:hypothetical protein PAPYR_6270 [Paratrimastix pyriformis]
MDYFAFRPTFLFVLIHTQHAFLHLYVPFFWAITPTSLPDGSTFAIPFPRRALVNADRQTTLADLGLHPSGVLLVVKQSNIAPREALFGPARSGLFLPWHVSSPLVCLASRAVSRLFHPWYVSSRLFHPWYVSPLVCLLASLLPPAGSWDRHGPGARRAGVGRTERGLRSTAAGIIPTHIIRVVRWGAFLGSPRLDHQRK